MAETESNIAITNQPEESKWEYSERIEYKESRNRTMDPFTHMNYSNPRINNLSYGQLKVVSNHKLI